MLHGFKRYHFILKSADCEYNFITVMYMDWPAYLSLDSVHK